MFWHGIVGGLVGTASLARGETIAEGKVEVNFYPSPWGSGGPDGWAEAYVKARDFVRGLTLVEKVNLVGFLGCVYREGRMLTTRRRRERDGVRTSPKVSLAFYSSRRVTFYEPSLGHGPKAPYLAPLEN